jgi:hypothetical protein
MLRGLPSHFMHTRCTQTRHVLPKYRMILNVLVCWRLETGALARSLQSQLLPRLLLQPHERAAQLLRQLGW